MKYIQKSLALLLVLAMLLAMVPAGMTASAEEIPPELTPVEAAAAEETPAEETVADEAPTEEPIPDEAPAEEPIPEKSPVDDPAAEKTEQPTMDTAIPGDPGIPTITDREESGFHVNPLYEGILDASDFPRADFSHMEGETSSVQSDYLSTTDAAQVIREYMLNRTEYYTVYIRATSSDRWTVFEDTLAEALAHNGNPKEGDSLQWQYGGWEASCSATGTGSTYLYTFTVYMPYYTTAEQEAQLDTAVSNLLAQLNLWNKTDYEKVCGVYDYICDNIEYDYTHLNDSSYLLMFTAYAALVNKTAVCQGYAVLFYRLMLELGVDARVIVGYGGGPHAWNIVELDDLYYNVDPTWDAGQPYYSYFLQSPNDFVGHTRDAEYETVAFHAAYPMSPVSYGETFDPDIHTLALDTWYTVTISRSSDSAYYQFTPSVSGYYTLSSSSGYDTRCTLYSSSWGLINSDDDSGDGYNFLLEAWLDAGSTYYYEVYFYDNSTGSFQILLEQTDGSSEGGGGSDTTITPLTLNQAVDGYISSGDQRVYYSFTPYVSGFYTICAYSESDTYCFVYDSNWNYLSAADDSGLGNNFFKTEYIDAGETFYYEVCFYSATETGSFQICMTEAGPTESGKLDNFVGGYYAVSDLTLGSDGIYRTPNGGTVYIAVDNDEEGGLFWLNNYTLYDFVSEYGTYYFDLTYWTSLTNLMDSDGYVALTETSLRYLVRLITGNANWQETEEYVPCYLFYDFSADEQESTIRPLSLDVTTTVTISTGGQYAYYSFTPSESGYYTLSASSGGNDTYCTLYDADWNRISYNDDGNTWDFLLTAWLEAGVTYYYEVRFLYLDTTGSFQILLTFDGAEEEEITVLPLSLDVSTTVTISTCGEYAYYSFTPSESGYYTLSASSGGYDTYCALYDANWNWLASNDDSNDSDFCLNAWLEAGVTYYYEVRFLYWDTTGSFQILLTFDGAEEEEITVLPLSLDVTTTVTISACGEYAYYSFTPSESGYYTLSASSGGQDTYCALYDTDWNWLASNDDSNDWDFCLNAWLNAGVTYYYEVRFLYWDTTGSFQILLTKPSYTGRLENNRNAFYAVSDLTLGSDGIYRTPDGCIMYIAVANYNDGGLYWLTDFLLEDNTLYGYVNTYGTTYFDLTYWDALVALMDEYGYVVLTPTTLQYLITTIAGNPQWEEDESYVPYYLFYDPTPTADTHTHAYTAVVTAPTCTEGGYTTYTCSACGDTYVGAYTDPTGHSYNSVVTAPTCTEGGYTTYTCSTCGDTYVGAYTDPTGHSYNSVVTAPTCTEGGYTTYTCSTCGDTYVGAYTDPTGHSYNSVVTAPTCTEEGYTTHICGYCGTGYIDSYVDPAGHNWDNGVVTLEPTEKTEGRCVYTCTVCRETREETLPVLDHVHSYADTVTAPTCTEAGYTTHTCSACGYSYTDTYVDATGHELSLQVTAPTCTRQGYTTHTCANCGYSYVDGYTPALGHAYIYRMTTEPTASSTGCLTGTCSRCSDTTTVEMPRLNSVDYTCEITLAPTMETEGSCIYTWKVTDYGVFSVTAVVPKLSDVMLGDMNGDGEVDIFDANLVVGYYNGTVTLTEAQLIAADVNGDGEVDIFDANLIVSYYNGTLPAFPAA